ncbi:hypothetical protein HanIR_Chr05g0210751 [Helianthus annuus]|nr:hypothetical protein HanIR_Chr05g0210751 [Helianthus annuus]
MFVPSPTDTGPPSMLPPSPSSCPRRPLEDVSDGPQQDKKAAIPSHTPLYIQYIHTHFRFILPFLHIHPLYRILMPILRVVYVPNHSLRKEHHHTV